jgi:hypothetical protein
LVPLWVHGLWDLWLRDVLGVPPLSSREPSWSTRIAVQGLASGVALAAIVLLRSRASLDFIYFQF